MKTINLVSFDVPYPADYGGVIDVYYKVKALHEIGVKVILHCYSYGRPAHEHLETVCDRVIYYNREKSPKDFFSSIPFIVKTRINNELVMNLNSNQYPILLEGIHCTGVILNNEIDKSRLVLRMHNNEKMYYRSLSKAEFNMFKGIFFSSEAMKLGTWQEKAYQTIPKIIGINKNELDEVKSENKLLVPCFHGYAPDDAYQVKDYVLIHGNFAVAENKAAILFFMDVITETPSVRYKVAGKFTDENLVKNLEAISNVELIRRPDDAEMKRLVFEAKLHIMYSKQATGVKLKFIRALYSGRPVICNTEVLDGTGLKAAAIICNNADEYKEAIHTYYSNDGRWNFKPELLKAYNDVKNAERLMTFIEK